MKSIDRPFSYLWSMSRKERQGVRKEEPSLLALHRSPFTAASGESMYLATSTLGIAGRSMCLFCFLEGRGGCVKTEHIWAQTMFNTSLPSFFPSLFL